MVSDRHVTNVKAFFPEVLILVIMEYGLGHLMMKAMNTLIRLNPCYNGIWSRTTYSRQIKVVNTIRLNPCYNGIWSRTEYHRVALSLTKS